MSLALVLLALTGTTLEASPAFAVAGETAQVELRLRVPGAKGRPTRLDLRASVGQVSAAVAVEGEPELFVARWTPPPQRFPQVALLHAVAEVEGEPEPFTAHLALPVHGRDAMKLKTKPRATVTVNVAGRSFGPAVANARGEVELVVVVPPGVDQVVVLSADRFGNRTRRAVDLRPPKFVRSYAFPARVDRAASWADPAPARLEVIAVTRQGKPAPPADLLSPTAQRGAVSDFQVVGPGLAVAAYRAPREVGGGEDLLEVKVRPEDSRPGLGRVGVLAGPPAKVAIVFEPEQFVAGAGAPVAVRVALTDAADNPCPPAPGLAVAAAVGQLSGEEDGVRQWVLSPALGGRREATLVASLGALTAERALALKPGPPQEGTLRLLDWRVHAGGRPLRAELTLADQFGNPVDGAALEARATKAGEVSVRAVEGGGYQLDWAPPADEVAGDASLEVQPQGSQLRLSERVLVLPYQRAVGVSAGAWGSAQWGGVPGGAAAAEVSLRPTRLGLEAVLQVGGTFYGAWRGPHPGNENAQLGARLRRQWAMAGVRGSLPVGPRLSLHASLLAGPNRTQAELEVLELNRALAPTSSTHNGWGVRVGAGAGWRLGPGRLMLEGRGGYAPPAGGLAGNLDGVAGAVGYLFEVR